MVVLTSSEATAAALLPFACWLIIPTLASLISAAAAAAAGPLHCR
jgi:hypothetical protein